VRLDIALVHRLQREAARKHSCGARQRPPHVTALDREAHRGVRGLARLLGEALGEHVLMQDGCVVAQGLLDADDMRQHLVVHLDQPERLLGDRLAGRGKGGDRLALVEHLALGHALLRDIFEVQCAFRTGDQARFYGREVGARDDRLDAGQRFGLPDVDAADARVGMRAAQHRTLKHVRGDIVGAIDRLAGDLLDPIGAYRAAADETELLPVARCLDGSLHGAVLSCLSSAAASITARMILS
jgi:hypothetical protein